MKEEININIFGDVRLSDVLEKIYKNSNDKKETINGVIDILQDKLTDMKGAVMLAPIISEFLNVGVQNDEQMIKMATIIQKLVATEQRNISSGNEELLTEFEKEQLTKAMPNRLEEMEKNTESLKNEFKKLEEIKEEIK